MVGADVHKTLCKGPNETTVEDVAGEYLHPIHLMGMSLSVTVICHKIKENLIPRAH